ncbi:MAG: hypothetical protein AAB505_01700 [Patescibacteria group bacterium]
MKKLFNYFPQGSPMYIVLHAQYRRVRGRRPAAISATECNPRRALRVAEKHVNGGDVIALAKPCTLRVVVEAMSRVGVRGLTKDEMLDRFGEPSFCRVPNLVKGEIDAWKKDRSRIFYAMT